jgi:hypothetical protein
MKDEPISEGDRILSQKLRAAFIELNNLLAEASQRQILTEIEILNVRIIGLADRTVIDARISKIL